jgi:hypothetical protein
MRTFTPEERQYILDHTKGTKDKDLAKMFNLHFGTDFDVGKFQSYKTRNDISNGLPRGWSKEFPPDNFGREPPNKRPIGSERFHSATGYMYVKVAEPAVWITKQVYMWQKYHGKTVPKSSIVIFLDNNKSNFDIDNLELITRAENSRLNKNRMRYDNAALTKSALNLIRLNSKIREVE